ncbi:MAG: amidohydrolase [bacterium]|nr:amidohydrolase [Deltaproteobacteria bacterium]MCP4903721.1 amidohydrolase [bacterium]
MSESFFDQYRAIDTDTHVTEPPDTWTSRLPKKWADDAPRLECVEGRDVWIMGGQNAGMGPGMVTAAGFDGTFPESRMTFDQCPIESYDSKARLDFMDKDGVYAQIIYPNAGGFGSGAFLSLKDPDLMLACVQAYNDFLVEWCSADPKRLIPVMAAPFWDVDAWVGEIERCAPLGHKAVLACNQPKAWGEPALFEPHWDRVYAAAQDHDLSISFHIGGGSFEDMAEEFGAGGGPKANFARVSSTIFADNSKQLADVIFGGVCHRFPNLKMVSVESGVGWICSALEAMDWQWRNGGVSKEHPEFDLLPSEYFERQIYGCFWFEEFALGSALERFPDNIMWETDYPHPTSMSPGPATPADPPRDYIDRALAGQPKDVVQKVLEGTASKVYHLD